MVAAQSRSVAVLFSMLFSGALAVAAFIIGRVTGAAVVVALGLLMMASALHQGLMLAKARHGGVVPDEGDGHNDGDHYFWCFAAGAIIYAACAGAALYHATLSVALTPLIEYSSAIYALLGFSTLCFAGAAYVGIDAIRDPKRELSLLDRLQTTGEPVLVTTAVEIVAGLCGVGIALLGVFAADRLGFVNADAAAAVALALVMATVAAVQLLTLRALIAGRVVSRDIVRAVTRTLALEVERSGAIRTLDDLRVRQIGRGQMQVAVRLAFKDGVDAAHIPRVFEKLVTRVRSEHGTVNDVVLMMAPSAAAPSVRDVEFSDRVSGDAKR